MFIYISWLIFMMIILCVIHFWVKGLHIGKQMHWISCWPYIYWCKCEYLKKWKIIYMIIRCNFLCWSQIYHYKFFIIWPMIQWIDAQLNFIFEFTTKSYIRCNVIISFHFHCESTNIRVSVNFVLCASNVTFCGEFKNTMGYFISLFVQWLCSI